MRVLIVDDDPLYRLAVATMLASDEFEFVVAEAEDGRPALEAIEHEAPDVMLLDLNMPQMSGLDVARTVRQRWPHVRVVIVTSADADDERERAVEAGVDGFIRKADLFRQARDGVALRTLLAVPAEP